MNTAKKTEGLGGLPQGNMFENLPDFTRIVHDTENNKFSQKHLDKNRYKFIGQAAALLTMLQKGEKVNDDTALRIHHIRRLSGRIHDIGVKGNIDIDREWGLDEDLEQVDLLVYFLPENRQEFIKRKWIIDRPRWWYSEKYTSTAIINQIKAQNAKK